jgi:hypothetical protein
MDVGVTNPQAAPSPPPPRAASPAGDKPRHVPAGPLPSGGGGAVGGAVVVRSKNAQRKKEEDDQREWSQLAAERGRQVDLLLIYH